jgi:Flp pilus assembly protein TadG
MGRLGEEPETASGERGAVLVIFALFMSLAVLLSAFVIDAGNWFEHQRHLQVQADAAAFAAAAKFNYPCTPTVEKAIYQTAGQYGGAETVLTPGGKSEGAATPLYNTQIGGTTQANIHEEINSKKYFGQASEDNTVEKAPCEPEASMIDVKMTETSLPWFFKILDVPRINAHARVSIVKQQFATAVEPIIESEPIEARVFYVNDSPDGSDSNYNDELLATGLLTNIGSNEEKGTIKWTDSSAPVAVKVNKPHIGVRIALAGKAGALTGAGNEGVSVCLHEYVECFDEDSGVVPPLLNISGYSKEGEGTAVPLAPVAHKVALSTPAPDTCTDAYFNDWPLSEKAATCSITLSAELQYGKESTSAAGITVTPELVYTEGFSNNKKTVKEAAMKLEGGLWTGTVNLPSYFYGNFGSTEIDLLVKCEPKVAKSVCEKATKTEEKKLTDVQRAFSAGPDGSDRIVAAKVFEPGGATPVPGEKDADAFELCEAADAQSCTHNLAVTVELSGSLEDAKKYFNSEGKPIPPFHVFYGDNDQENDDQFVMSCPPTTSKVGVVALYEEALNVGCKGKYSVNSHGGSCTAEKATQEKIAAEETAEKEKREKEEAAKKARETKEKEAKAKWEAEEKETKITKAQRETKEKEQTTTRTADEKAEKEALEKEEAAKTKREKEEKEAREKWAAEEKETKITKAQRETKEKELKTQLEKEEKAKTITKAQRETKEKESKTQWEKEEKETKLTKAQRETKETEQTTTRTAAEKAEKEARELRATAKAKREKEEKEAREKWAAEEKETKITKAQRETKEKEQATAREAAEKEEAVARAKRENEEAATKGAKEKQEGAAHECVGLVEANGKENFKGVSEGEQADELTAVFQNYLAKRIEGQLNGTKFECPNKWVNNNQGGIPIIPANDSRLIQFFVVPFTVTDFERKNQVSPLVPIANFATFYVTGWDSGNLEAGQGTGKAWNPKERRDGCSEKLFKRLPVAEREELENEAIPLKQREQKEKEKGFDDDTEQPREVVGHLIKYVNVLGEVAGTEGCKPEGVETCEAVLTE